MSWLEDIKKDLEDSSNHPVRKKKDWEIERDIRLKDMAKYGSSLGSSKGGKIGGEVNKKSGQASELGKKYTYNNHLGQKLTTKNKEWRMVYGMKGAKTRGKQLSENNDICYKGGKSRGEQLKNSFKTCKHCKQTLKESLYYAKSHHKGECVETYDEYVKIAEMYFNEGLSRTKLGKKLGIPPHRVQMAYNWYRKNNEWYSKVKK